MSAFSIVSLFTFSRVVCGLKPNCFGGIKSFLFNVYHSAAVFALDLQVVACLRDAAAVGALNGVQAEVVGTIVEGDDFVFLDGVVCQILLVDAHAHCVYNFVWLHREMVCNFGCVSETFAFYRIDDASVLLFWCIGNPRHRRAVKSEHYKHDAYCHNRREKCASFFIARCANYCHCYAQREHNRQNYAYKKSQGQILLKFVNFFIVFHTHIVLQKPL